MRVTVSADTDHVLFSTAALLALLAAPPGGAAHDTLRILLVADDTVARVALVRGVVLGADEAAHTGALFGTAVTVRVVEPPDSAAAATAIGASVPGAGPSLVIVAADGARCAAVFRETARRGLPALDAGCGTPDSPRSQNVFALVPTPASTSDSTRLELWHWSLDRFGAEQLNQRYERRFGERMSSAAWTGWMATKIALDLALRAHATNGAALLARLADPATQFDGQKGRPLRFARDTRRLVQPMYRVAGVGDSSHVLAEVAP